MRIGRPKSLWLGLSALVIEKGILAVRRSSSSSLEYGTVNSLVCGPTSLPSLFPKSSYFWMSCCELSCAFLSQLILYSSRVFPFG